MDRRTWLAERRAAVVAEYDEMATTYDEHEYPNEGQQLFVARLLEKCPPGGVVLDAGCGTGRYFAMVTATGRLVVGTDQSTGMLERAEARGLAVSTRRVALQDLAYRDAFDAVMTIDAMENVAPEDWPQVLANLRRAVRPGGHLYLSVEDRSDARIDAAHAALVAAGQPAVRGEVVDGDVAGYHYYPGREAVLQWIALEGLEVVGETYTQEGESWGYRHLMLRAPEHEAAR